MGGHEHCTFQVLAAEELEIPEIVVSGGFEAVNNRIRLVVILTQLGFLYQIGSSDQFDSQLQVPPLHHLQLIVRSLLCTPQIILQGADGIGSLLVVLSLDLLGNAFDGPLQEGLLSVNQNPNIVAILH